MTINTALETAEAKLTDAAAALNLAQSIVDGILAEEAIASPSSGDLMADLMNGIPEIPAELVARKNVAITLRNLAQKHWAGCHDAAAVARYEAGR